MKTRSAALITLVGIVALALMACSPPEVVSGDPLGGNLVGTDKLRPDQTH